MMLMGDLPAVAEDPNSPIAIPPQPGARPVPFFLGQEAPPHPINTRPIPQNPFVAAGSWAYNYHCDAYQSDTYFIEGPLGHKPKVTSSFWGTNSLMVSPISFGQDGWLFVGQLQPDAGGSLRWRINMVHPDTLTIVDELELPKGPLSTDEVPAGSYWYMDNANQMVIATAEQTIWAVPHTPDGFDREHITVYDLSGEMRAKDSIKCIMPDFLGRVWFVTKFGLLGTLDRAKNNGCGQVLGTLALSAGEAAENGLATDEDGGMYFVSSQFMYRFDADAEGAPTTTWREPYDTGTHVKVLSRGSGTTPTLMGTDYVAIADNADPQIHVLVYRRAKQLSPGQSRLVCAVPVFKPGQSCTENSFIATDNAVVVENNFGARTLKATMHGKTTEPGITRLDIASNAGWLRWNNTEETVTCAATEKLSVKTGLIYAYTKSKGPPNTDAWYFTAIDFHTGETVYKVLAGTGLLYADPVSSMFIGPNRRLYIGVLGGIVMMQDGP